MVRPINLFSLAGITDDTLAKKCICISGSEIKKHEVGSVRSLCHGLRGKGLRPSDVNGFYVGFKIPQISKEFDLLRVGDAIVDIELKSKFTAGRKNMQAIIAKQALS